VNDGCAGRPVTRSCWSQRDGTEDGIAYELEAAFPGEAFVGSIAALPQAERDRVIARVRHLIASAPELAGKPEITFLSLC